MTLLTSFSKELVFDGVSLGSKIRTTLWQRKVAQEIVRRVLHNFGLHSGVDHNAGHPFSVLELAALKFNERRGCGPSTTAARWSGSS